MWSSLNVVVVMVSVLAEDLFFEINIFNLLLHLWSLKNDFKY